MSLARYYAWLSRFEDASGLFATADTGTTDRAPAAGGQVVLDAGCGLGGTTFFLQACLGGRYRGITLSPDQAARATAEAARRGLSAMCHFAVRSYHDDLADLLPDGADLIVAIESLAHAPDPPATSPAFAAAGMRQPWPMPQR